MRAWVSQAGRFQVARDEPREEAGPGDCSLKDLHQALRDGLTALGLVHSVHSAILDRVTE